MDTLQCACECSHTSIYTSNLLVMRSVLLLELREGERDWKRDERGMSRGVKTKKLPCQVVPLEVRVQCSHRLGSEEGRCLCFSWPGPEQVWSAGVFPTRTDGQCSRCCCQSRTYGGTETQVSRHSSSCYIERMEVDQSSTFQTCMCVHVCV